MTSTWNAINLWLPLTVAATATAGVLLFALLTGRFRRRPADGGLGTVRGPDAGDPLPQPARDRA
jgi:hypothetical protein